MDYGKPLRVGLIVRFRHPGVDFDEALKAGPDHRLEYFSDILGGLCVGHIEELRKLGFFSAIEEKTGLKVDVGSWEEIRAGELQYLAQIIENILDQAPEEISRLLVDLLDMSRSAEAEGCSMGFMLAD
jgi:hypothetical protein